MKRVRVKRHPSLIVLGAILLLFASLLPTYIGIEHYDQILVDRGARYLAIEQQIDQKQGDYIATVKAIVEKAQANDDAKRQAAEVTKDATLTTPATSVNSSSCNTATIHNDPTKIDVLVNKKHCIQPVTFVPTLKTVDGASLVPEAAIQFDLLYKAAAAAGEPITVTSSYRSYNTQVSTYNYWVSTSGKAGADTYSARPGYSEHQTGLALDVQTPGGCSLDCFGTSSQYTWMQAHSRDYGFIQRYYAGEETITGYKAEEWHYRYVGVAVAKDMESKGIKTLEAYWSMSGGDY